MSDFYRDMQAIGSNLLQDFDQGGVEYIAVTPGTGPADNPGPALETPVAINAVARGVSFRYIDGSNIVATDLQLTMAGNTVKPVVNGFVRVNGVRHKIIQVVAKPATGIPAAFTLIFRK